MERIPNGIAPNRYVVYFKSGHSEEEHYTNAIVHMKWLCPRIKTAEGKNEIAYLNTFPVGVYYCGEFTESIINEIRARPEVDFVENEGYCELVIY